MQIIVNADDLGGDAAVDREITKQIRNGRVTSATILANGPNVEFAASVAREWPEVSFGVHLCLTEFRPCSSSSELAPLLDQKGCFAGNKIRAIRLRATIVDAIFEEWSTQVEKLLDLGVPVSHIDSHHHVHTIPELFIPLKRLQTRFNITRVRLSKNMYSRNENISTTLRAKKALWNLALKRLVRTRTADVFTSLETIWECRYMKSKPCVVELMVHPGNRGFAKENRLLACSWEQHFPVPIQLISYHDI